MRVLHVDLWHLRVECNYHSSFCYIDQKQEEVPRQGLLKSLAFFEDVREHICKILSVARLLGLWVEETGWMAKDVHKRLTTFSSQLLSSIF